MCVYVRVHARAWEVARVAVTPSNNFPTRVGSFERIINRNHDTYSKYIHTYIHTYFPFKEVLSLGLKSDKESWCIYTCIHTYIQYYTAE
jgi:hypothetical protein